MLILCSGICFCRDQVFYGFAPASAKAIRCTAALRSGSVWLIKWISYFSRFGIESTNGAIPSTAGVDMIIAPAKINTHADFLFLRECTGAITIQNQQPQGTRHKDCLLRIQFTTDALFDTQSGEDEIFKTRFFSFVACAFRLETRSFTTAAPYPATQNVDLYFREGDISEPEWNKWAKLTYEVTARKASDKVQAKLTEYVKKKGADAIIFDDVSLTMHGKHLGWRREQVQDVNVFSLGCSPPKPNTRKVSRWRQPLSSTKEYLITAQSAYLPPSGCCIAGWSL